MELRAPCSLNLCDVSLSNRRALQRLHLLLGLLLFWTAFMDIDLFSDNSHISIHECKKGLQLRADAGRETSDDGTLML